jgi:hypothetical protein
MCQFAPWMVICAEGSIQTLIKFSHNGSDFLTAAVIACSIVARKTRVRPAGLRFFLKDGITSSR